MLETIQLDKEKEVVMVDRIPLPEAPGVCWIDLYTPEGDKISVTSRAVSTEDALTNLMGAIHFAEQEYSLLPRNKATDPYAAATVKEIPNVLQEAPQEVPPWVEEMDTTQPVPQTTTDDKPGVSYGLLEYPLKKTVSRPGDTYQVTVHEYEAKEGGVRFYQMGNQYPAITQNITNAYGMELFERLFKGWKPNDDGGRYAIPGGSIKLGVVCSDKLTSQGNPYHNLSSVDR